MINRGTIERVQELLHQVDELCGIVLDEINTEYPSSENPYDSMLIGTKHTAALRRRSMDLTRELAELRRPG